MERELDEDPMGYDCRPGGPPSSNTGINREPRKAKRQPPQDTVKQFWEKFNTKYPGKVFTVLPDNPYARKKAAKVPKGVVQGQKAVKSYNQAKQECEKAVERIIKECRRVNQKYRDPHFDIEVDLKSRRDDCLNGLNKTDPGMRPKGVKRVTDIFEDPQFYINGPSAGDVRQGRDGDCWLMAALCALGNKEGLIEKICVAMDQDVGVYGFVFHRDGEWQQCIIDDKLYLRAADYDESVEERQVWDDINRTDSEEEYQKAYQTGSRALYFAQCSEENETWLPLLEKAFAKAHGDYSSIDGGYVGEAVEDLTGGVTSEIFSTDILDKNKFWRDELLHVNKDFLFGCATGFFSNWLDPRYDGPPRERRGISEGHAYSIMDAKEVNGEKLLKLRNPWGKKEWNGAWADGSEQWTPEWMKLLDHKFGNDGMFWISYKDLLRKYQHFDRTRIFGPEWNITQQWTSLNVPYSADYHSTKFAMTVTEKSPIVIVLSQLDTRYFNGLEGEYTFTLQFRLELDDGKTDEEDYIVRSHGNYAMERSVSTDIELEKGRYSVLMKITAVRNSGTSTPEEVVRACAQNRREKLVQMGLSYDLAHAKGRMVESEKEKMEREEREKRTKMKERKKLRDQIEKAKRKEWEYEKKMAARRKREALKQERIQARRMALIGGERGRPQSVTGNNGSLSDEYEHEEPLENGHNTIDNAEAAASEEPAAGIPSPPADLVQPLADVVKAADEQTSPTNNKDPIPEIHINGVEAVKDISPLNEIKPLDHHDHIHAPDDLAADDYESDVDSFRSFEFDSEIDMPPFESDNEAHHVSKQPPPQPQSPDDNDDEFANDPWNAVCVVGLRVYSKDPALCLEVIRPKNDDDTEAPLDRDDPAKGASNVDAQANGTRTPVYT